MVWWWFSIEGKCQKEEEEEKEGPKIRGGEEEALCLKDRLRNLILIQIGLFSQATSRSPPSPRK